MVLAVHRSSNHLRQFAGTTSNEESSCDTEPVPVAEEGRRVTRQPRGRTWPGAKAIGVKEAQVTDFPGQGRLALARHKSSL